MNIFENGFLERVQARRRPTCARTSRRVAAAGNPCSFAYRGPGTGTSPLPTYLAYFSGVNQSQAGNPARYTSAQLHQQRLDRPSRRSSSPIRSMRPTTSGRAGARRRTNALNAGLRSQLLRPEPGGRRREHHRRRGGQPVSLDADRRAPAPVAGLHHPGQLHVRPAVGLVTQDLHRDRIYLKTDNLPHAFKFNWLYEVPVGRGKRFGTDMNACSTRIIGGWEFSGTGRVQVRDFGVTGMAAGGHVRRRAQRRVRDPRGAERRRAE